MTAVSEEGVVLAWLEPVYHITGSHRTPPGYRLRNSSGSNSARKSIGGLSSPTCRRETPTSTLCADPTGIRFAEPKRNIAEEVARQLCPTPVDVDAFHTTGHNTRYRRLDHRANRLMKIVPVTRRPAAHCGQ